LIQHQFHHGACGGRSGAVCVNVSRRCHTVVEQSELLRHSIRIGRAGLSGKVGK
jgi:hypothetical protein